MNILNRGTWAHYRSNAEGRFTVNDIDPTLCSHIIYSFLNADEQGNVIHFDEHTDIGLGKTFNLEFRFISTPLHENKMEKIPFNSKSHTKAVCGLFKKIPL